MLAVAAASAFFPSVLRQHLEDVAASFHGEVHAVFAVLDVDVVGTLKHGEIDPAFRTHQVHQWERLAIQFDLNFGQVLHGLSCESLPFTTFHVAEESHKRG